MIRMAVLAALACAPLFALESTEAMLSACQPIADAPVSQQTIQVQQTFEGGLCWGAMGALAAILGMVDPGGIAMFHVCAPAGATRKQFIAVFVGYALAHPERHHEPYFVVAANAFRKAFPCGSTSLVPSRP